MNSSPALVAICCFLLFCFCVASILTILNLIVLIVTKILEGRKDSNDSYRQVKILFNDLPSNCF